MRTRNYLILGAMLVACLYVALKAYWCNHTHTTLRNMAVDIFGAFNQAGVKYWADYGTLLGIHREGDIIEHDDDIDVCVIDTPENHMRIRKAMVLMSKKNDKYTFGFEPWGAYRINYPGLFKFKNFADVYITKIEDGKYVDPTGKIPIEIVGRIQYIDWKGVKVPVPEHLEKTLVWRYGDSWRTPIRGVSNIR